MELQKNVKLVVPNHWSSTEKGAFFEDIISELMRNARYEVEARVRLSGMEIDVLARHRDSKEKAYVECKFEKKALAAEVLTKALGNAMVHDVSLVYVFSTSPPGKDAKGILETLRSRDNGPKLSYHGPTELFEWLVKTRNISLPELTSRVNSITLLIHPDFQCWIAVETENGIPKLAIIFPIEGSKEIDEQIVQNEFLGVDVICAKNNRPDHVLTRIKDLEEEIITAVSMAESFDDYRPCRPEDFVGRMPIQQKVYEFLERVRDKSSTTRVICFKGDSGYGKSSTVIKLAHEWKQATYQDKYFLYPIDVRSAKTPLFVAKAVRSAFQKALDEGFIHSSESSVSIGISELLLSSESIQEIILNLEKDNKMIVIFFDQFEELFTKVSLSSVFDAFSYLALEIDSLQANVVLGFSWRTGLNPPEDHRAFYFWHTLQDKRYELSLEPFTEEEAPQLLSKLSKYIKGGLNKRLKQRLLDDSQRRPWMLKKLSIHVFRQINNGVTQLELLSQQFNIASLFDEDLEKLSSKEKLCLKYIADKSPAATIEVMEKFGNIPDRLIEYRLIMKVGQNYTLYWDIFRDYLLKGEIPVIDWKYIPRTQISIVIKVIEILQDRPIDAKDLAEQIQYSQGGFWNLMIDLQNFFLAKRDQNLIVIQDELKSASTMQIADHICKQLNQHVVVKKMREKFTVEKNILPDEFRQLIAITSPGKMLSKRTLETYSRRIIQWSIFAGLIELRDGAEIIPLETGAQKGVIPSEQHEVSDIKQFELFDNI
jgi:hypothetical protein